MKAKEIRSTDKISINEKILEMKKELVKMNAQVATGSTIKSPGQVRKIKKTLARIITIQQEKNKVKREKEKKLEADKKI